MNDYSPIARYIKAYQLQRSVALAEVIADGFVWLFRGIENLTGRIPGPLVRKPEGIKAATQH